MNHGSRMSPLTAVFLGIWIVGAVAIASGTAIVLYGMRVVDTNASGLLKFVDNTVDGLPDLIDSLPPALSDMLHDRRAPEYIDQIAVSVHFNTGGRSGGLYPAVTITNNSDKVISLLGLRVAALSPSKVPVRDWGKVVATPIPLDDDAWPGPLMPGQTRHIVMSSWRTVPVDQANNITSAFEISELRVWEPDADVSKSSVAGR